MITINKNNLIITFAVSLGWIVSLIIAWNIFSQPRNNLNKLFPNNKTQLDNELSDKGNSSATKRPRPKTPSTHTKSLMQQLEGIPFLSGQTSFFLENKSNDEIMQFITDIAADENKNQRSWAQRKAEAFCVLGRRNPKLSLDFYTSIRLQYDFNYLINAPDEILSYWAEENLTDAVKYLQANREIFGSAHEDIFRRLAEKDLSEAIKALDGYQNSLGKYGAIEGISSTLENSEEYLTFLNQLVLREDISEDFVNPVIEEWAKKKPLDAFVWAESFYSKDKFNEVFDIFLIADALKVEADFESTIDWVSTKYVDQADFNLYIDLFIANAFDERVENWFIKQPPSQEKDDAIVVLLRNLHSNEPQKYLSLMQNDSARNDAVKTIYKSYTQNYPELANDFLAQNTDLTDTEKEQLKNSFDESFNNQKGSQENE